MNELKTIFSLMKETEESHQKMELATDNGVDFHLTVIEDFKKRQGVCATNSLNTNELHAMFIQISKVLGIKINE
ncbi:hypothetical protein Q7A53_05310 [Halobacillus rhizosphaerae]|uniref:hypothetical protein n=1 Tax=Halobacillus rhizosphaerae TaxID=3064889 RepID=UPI00398B4AB6